MNWRAIFHGLLFFNVFWLAWGVIALFGKGGLGALSAFLPLVCSLCATAVLMLLARSRANRKAGAFSQDQAIEKSPLRGGRILYYAAEILGAFALCLFLFFRKKYGW